MRTSNDEAPEQDAALLKAAERVISNTLGSAVAFQSMQRLTQPDRRSALYRCFAGPGSAPEKTYIVKKMADAADFDPNSAAGEEALWRLRSFFNDWIGAEFLSSIPSDDPISPRFYGGDLSAGFFILEDLGEHRSLVHPLLHGDPATASIEAEAALLRYSTCLGKLHAITAGRSQAYEALYAARMPGARPLAYELDDLEPRMQRVQVLLEQFGVPVGDQLLAEIQAMMNALTHPGPFLAYIHADPCPDNVFDLGDRFRLIDFETGHFGHALLDAVYPRMIWPTCWCANRLPRETVTRMENRYRAELIVGCPQAQEDAVWETALMHLCGLAMINTLGYSLEETLKEDHEWGLATMRQRTLVRLEAFIAAAEEFHRLPALRGAASRLLPQLKERWEETQPLPLYPAFQK